QVSVGLLNIGYLPANRAEAIDGAYHLGLPALSGQVIIPGNAQFGDAHAEQGQQAQFILAQLRQLDNGLLIGQTIGTSLIKGGWKLVTAPLASLVAQFLGNIRQAYFGQNAVVIFLLLSQLQ